MCSICLFFFPRKKWRVKVLFLIAFITKKKRCFLHLYNFFLMTHGVCKNKFTASLQFTRLTASMKSCVKWTLKLQTWFAFAPNIITAQCSRNTKRNLQQQFSNYRARRRIFFWNRGNFAKYGYPLPGCVKYKEHTNASRVKGNSEKRYQQCRAISCCNKWDTGFLRVPRKWKMRNTSARWKSSGQRNTGSERKWWEREKEKERGCRIWMNPASDEHQPNSSSHAIRTHNGNKTFHYDGHCVVKHFISTDTLTK